MGDQWRCDGDPRGTPDGHRRDDEVHVSTEDPSARHHRNGGRTCSPAHSPATRAGPEHRAIPSGPTRTHRRDDRPAPPAALSGGAPSPAASTGSRTPATSPVTSWPMPLAGTMRSRSSPSWRRTPCGTPAAAVPMGPSSLRSPARPPRSLSRFMTAVGAAVPASARPSGLMRSVAGACPGRRDRRPGRVRGRRRGGPQGVGEDSHPSRPIDLKAYGSTVLSPVY